MTKTEMRDQFAGQALQGICSNLNGNPSPQKIAEMAYKIADAMLKEKEARE